MTCPFLALGPFVRFRSTDARFRALTLFVGAHPHTFRADDARTRGEPWLFSRARQGGVDLVAGARHLLARSPHAFVRSVLVGERFRRTELRKPFEPRRAPTIVRPRLAPALHQLSFSCSPRGVSILAKALSFRISFSLALREVFQFSLKLSLSDFRSLALSEVYKVSLSRQYVRLLSRTLHRQRCAFAFT